jgi:hypothetical protein
MGLAKKLTQICIVDPCVLTPLARLGALATQAKTSHKEIRTLWIDLLGFNGTAFRTS